MCWLRNPPHGDQLPPEHYIAEGDDFFNITEAAQGFWVPVPCFRSLFRFPLWFAETAYLLCFAMLMLNTDAHNSTVHTKMTRQQVLPLRQDSALGQYCVKSFDAFHCGKRPGVLCFGQVTERKWEKGNATSKIGNRFVCENNAVNAIKNI